MVHAPTLEGWYLPQGPAVAISCTTAIYALLFSGVSRREGGRAEIGVARIECSSAQGQKKCEEYGDDSKRPLVTFHGPAPLGRKTRRVWSDGGRLFRAARWSRHDGVTRLLARVAGSFGRFHFRNDPVQIIGLRRLQRRESFV